MLGDTDTIPSIKGDESREAIDSLRGYVYQIYQSSLAWVELKSEEILFLEVAEDYAVAAVDALKAVQVKETAKNVTINSDDIIASIDSFVELRKDNPDLKVKLRHLTTSKVGKEKSKEYRINETPTLITWRKLAKTRDLNPLRKILSISKLSKQSKEHIQNLNDTDFREEFLKKIHFDCGALNSKFLLRQLRSKLLEHVIERGGVESQVDNCLNNLFMTLLYKATKKEDRFVDRNTLEKIIEKATQIPINRAQFELQNQLINKALAASGSPTTSLVSTRLIEPRSIDEIPFPVAIANRTNQIDNIISSLQSYGVSWIYGAAGVGKTIGAKIAGSRLGGKWATINLRGLVAEQVSAVLSEYIVWLNNSGVDGLLVDDMECQFEPHIVDKLLYLFDVCARTDLLLLFTSPRPPNNDFLFSANLPKNIEQKISEFTENDIGEVLTGLGIDSTIWAKYIHIVSGGGHPQLAIAAIQNMQSSGWNINELKTLNSLINGNTAIDLVRANTRERLLTELPEGGRRLLERLSLKSGGFKRNFALEIGQIEPTIPDSGIIFDQLIGSWVDQQAQDRFALSPLLSNFATNTLTDEQKEKTNFQIASFLTKGQTLDPIESNSALLAAWSGKNTEVIMKLCMAVLSADQEEHEVISPHLMMFRIMRTDVLAYEDNLSVNQMFRGVQLLLICYEEDGKERFQEALNCFETESDLVENEVSRLMMTMMVYSKLLLSSPKFGALPNFWNLICQLDVILQNQNKKIPSEILEATQSAPELNGASLIGFLFLNQTQEITQINDLIPLFDFLDKCEEEFRLKLFAPFDNPDFDVKMLVTGAWVNEDKLNTIDPSVHSDVYARLEEIALGWKHTDLAVSCRNLRVIITDEYGGKKDLAIEVLDEGLKLYGETNSELIRAKSKVLYRAEDHQSSLELSKILIESDAPLDDIEKAFLGRESAISAEKQGDYNSARQYYLYGSRAAGNSPIPNMAPMKVGLMADAALASWHSNDRESCLYDFIEVLQNLKDIDPKSSLRAAHCHAISRHVLLWLEGDITGRKILLENDGDLKVYPGIVSNPEPHPEIAKQYITPIEMAWYMLAKIENYSCFNVGVEQNLDKFLPNGPVVEGQLLLASSKMEKAFRLSETTLFLESLEETIAQEVYITERGDPENSFNLENVTYGSLPVPTLEQQSAFTDRTERYVITFITSCILVDKVIELDLFAKTLEENKKFKIRKIFINCLKSSDTSEDYSASTATLMAFHIRVMDENETLSPKQVYEFFFRALQYIVILGMTKAFVKPAFEWLNKKWEFMVKNQRFLLKNPNLHEQSVSLALGTEDYSINKLIDLMQTILPAIGISNEGELREILNNYRDNLSKF